LAASRARIVAAADEAHRRIQRDLHDGAQQQLVSLMPELEVAKDAEQVSELKAELARTKQGLAVVLDELREIFRGLHPAILSRGGLQPALRALARRSAGRLDLRAEGRLPEPVEIAAYDAVSEALTNVAKHANASVIDVALDARDAIMRLVISDDGVGGAVRGPGSGLVGRQSGASIPPRPTRKRPERSSWRLLDQRATAPGRLLAGTNQAIGKWAAAAGAPTTRRVPRLATTGLPADASVLGGPGR
jgi:glucose-6-phosphate-specific signal transduction histidine kinase